MPIYEYGCAQCGHAFELLQKMSDEAPSTCPKCEEAGGIKKLVSRTSFVLKGGGWYKDHYGLKSAAGSTGDTGSTSGGESASKPSSGGSGSPSSSSSSSSSSGESTSKSSAGDSTGTSSSGSSD